MKKLFAIFCCAIFAIGLSSCDNDDDDNYYYSNVSGDGSISIAGYYPYWLYRMVQTSSDSDIYTYLLGGTTTVTSSGDFRGRGAAVYYKYDSVEPNAMASGTLTIGEDGVEAGYTTYIDYDRDDDDYISLVSGSIQIVTVKSGYYKIRILAVDEDGNDISIGYNGYRFANLIDDSSTDDNE